MIHEWSFNGVNYKFDWGRWDEKSFSLTYKDKVYKIELIKRINANVALVSFEGKNKILMKSGELISVGAKTIEALDAKSRKKSSTGAADEDMSSPMPGKILKVLVAKGDQVTPGQGLLVMEAMKMEHTIKAAFAGVVNKVLYGEGELVGGGVELIEIEPDKKEES